MRTAAHPLAPIFRSTTQERILAALFLDVDHNYNMHELAAKIDRPYASVHREVDRLSDAGLIVKEKVGQASLLHPNTHSPAYAPLRDLLLVAFGAVPLLTEALKGLTGIDAVVIFGSYASRLKGISGPPPEDIDVLIIGDPDPMALFASVSVPSQALGLPVNPTVLSRVEWAERTPFTEDVRRGSIIPVLGTLPTEGVEV